MADVSGLPLRRLKGVYDQEASAHALKLKVAQSLHASLQGYARELQGLHASETSETVQAAMQAVRGKARETQARLDTLEPILERGAARLGHMRALIEERQRRVVEDESALERFVALNTVPPCVVSPDAGTVGDASLVTPLHGLDGVVVTIQDIVDGTPAVRGLRERLAAYPDLLDEIVQGVSYAGQDGFLVSEGYEDDGFGLSVANTVANKLDGLIAVAKSAMLVAPLLPSLDDVRDLSGQLEMMVKHFVFGLDRDAGLGAGDGWSSLRAMWTGLVVGFRTRDIDVHAVLTRLSNDDLGQLLTRFLVDPVLQVAGV